MAKAMRSGDRVKLARHYIDRLKATPEASKRLCAARGVVMSDSTVAHCYVRWGDVPADYMYSTDFVDDLELVEDHHA